MATAQEQASRFQQALDARGVKYDKIDDYDRPLFKINFGGGEFNFSHVTVNVLFDNDGESAQFITGTIVSIPQNKTAESLIACNNANRDYRWIKLYIDNDNDLIGQCDAVIDEVTCGDECLELTYRMVSIIDDVYGNFMKAIWS